MTDIPIRIIIWLCVSGVVICDVAALILAADFLYNIIKPAYLTTHRILCPIAKTLGRAFLVFLTALTAMETLASRALATLQAHNSKSTETKLQHLTDLKQEIKHRQCPEAAIPTIFHVVRISIATPHLVDAGFSILSHLTKRLVLQDQSATCHEQFTKLLPVLAERLGDQKERARHRAIIALGDAYAVSANAQKDVQQFVCGTLLEGKNPRMKESAMHFIVTMHEERGMLFKMFVSGMVDCCEDADGSVRMTAQNTIITLFKNAELRAKNDLQKRLENRGVRKTIVTRVFSELAHVTADDFTKDSAAGLSMLSPDPSQVRHAPPDRPQNLIYTTNESPPEPAPMSVSEQEAVLIEPLYVESSRDIEEIFREMNPWFEGKEAESNWLRREKSILKLRRLTRGNAPHQYATTFLANVKALLDGILKAVNSLRTTVCTIGCHFIQDLARECGSGLDNMVEILLQSLIKLCGNTKKISAAKANDTVTSIMAHVSYHLRLLQHIHHATQDKNVQPRTYACGWLKTILSAHEHLVFTIEHSGGLDLIEKSIVVGLSDGNPSVRENMRPVYWAYAKIWPQKSETIMSGLSFTHQDMLLKNPANPNPPSKPIPTAGRGSKSALSKSTGTVSSRPSIRETIAAQKKAQTAGKHLPERPGSAESFPPPEKTLAPTRPATAMSTASRHVSTQSTGTLSSAPVRPRRRADTARHATTDAPAKKPARAETPPGSPARSPTKLKPKSPGSTANPTILTPQKINSPTTIPPKANSSKKLTFNEVSPTKAAEDFTMVVPSLNQGVTSSSSTGEVFDDCPLPLSTTASSPSNVGAFELQTASKLENINPGHDNDACSKSSLFLSTTDTSQPKSQAAERPVVSNLGSTDSNLVENASSNSLLPLSTIAPSQSNSRALERQAVSHSDTTTSRISMNPRDIIGRKENLRPRYITQNQQAGVSDLSPPSIWPSKTLGKLSLGEKHGQQNDMPDDVRRILEEDRAEENPPKYADSLKHIARRRSSSFRSISNPLYARRVLQSGISAIQARSIDYQGFRELQDLWPSAPENIWEEGYKFEELLTALLDYLESLNPSRRENVKIQILIVIMLLLKHQRQYFDNFYPQTLCTIIAARQHCPPTSRFCAGLEEVATDIVAHCEPSAPIPAILDLLEVDQSTETHLLGLHVLAELLHQCHENNCAVSETQMERLWQHGTARLYDIQPDIRRAGVDILVEARYNIDAKKFWGALNNIEWYFKALITYYLTRSKGFHP